MDSSSRRYEIPAVGSLGLLALGWRGLEAWREARGTTLPTSVDRPGASQFPDAQDAEVVVVSGLPRSGTSMVMQMLVAYGIPAYTDGAREADESNPRGYYEHEAVRALAKSSDWIPEADGHALKVVAPLIPSLPSGPRYRVILIERDLDEVLRSQAAMLAREGRETGSDDTLRTAYARHLRVAHDWLRANAEVLVLGHADVIAHPRDAAHRLHDFLGGSGDLEAMAAVVSPQLHRQRT